MSGFDPERIAAMHRAWNERMSGEDVSRYPVDVQDIIREVCKLWNLKPPQRTKQKGYWINGARDLIEACGEFGVECVRQLRSDFERHMENNRGLAPFTVEGPNSLVKAARSKAGQMRSPAVSSAQVPSAVARSVLRHYKDNQEE